MITSTCCSRDQARSVISTGRIMENFTVEEVCQYLNESISDIDETVVESFRKHKIDGLTFIQLNEEYLRELAPLLGDRIKIKKLVSDALNQPETVDDLEVEVG